MLLLFLILTSLSLFSCQTIDDIQAKRINNSFDKDFKRLYKLVNKN